ncbi:unnamed protein product, partial [Oppiella nova]
SSILSALFRTHECEGTILLDGVDTKQIGLHDLRRHVSIIPQEPIAFIGSLRKNLDPFSEHSDQEVWAALDEVQLREAVMEMPGQLAYELSEGGGNLSVGQRQLICLSRAILRRNRILVLDEATANVDHKTDALIQRTIRHNFADCTVVTIAHRLNTIIDSDRVLVMDAGRVREFDRPYRLLQNPNGMFYKLVRETGQPMAGELMAAAKRASVGTDAYSDVWLCKASQLVRDGNGYFVDAYMACKMTSIETFSYDEVRGISLPVDITVGRLLKEGDAHNGLTHENIVICEEVLYVSQPIETPASHSCDASYSSSYATETSGNGSTGRSTKNFRNGSLTSGSNR